MKTSELARETWELLFSLLTTAGLRVPSVAAECGLTEAQCHLLRMLNPGEPVSMRSVAEGLACHASNITGIVDRLEERELVARRPAPNDRRVKALVLTAQGARVRAKLVERLSEPPPPIAQLSSRDQAALCAILRRAKGQS
jgi:DNA-binding MarR family transcriptional regulator